MYDCTIQHYVYDPKSHQSIPNWTIEGERPAATRNASATIPQVKIRRGTVLSTLYLPYCFVLLPSPPHLTKYPCGQKICYTNNVSFCQ